MREWMEIRVGCVEVKRGSVATPQARELFEAEQGLQTSRRARDAHVSACQGGLPRKTELR